MWNGGLFLIMNHINDMILEGQVCGLQPLRKIIYEHAYLTPYSVMNVRLAAQVLSTTVSKVLSNYGPADAAGTAEFCLMFDKFFDNMNVSSTTASSSQQKPFKASISSTNDPRFSWLKNQFLRYFEDWLRSVKEGSGAYTKSEKQKMFISLQTYEGLKINVHSVIELAQFLIVHKDFAKIHQKTTLASHNLLELAKITNPSITLAMTILSETKNYSNQQQQAIMYVMKI